MTRGISSNGRAPASHAGGTGIDTRILQYVSFYSVRKENLLISNDFAFYLP